MFNQPQPTDSYSRLMTELFDEREVIGVSTGFLSIFGNPMNGSRTIYSPDSSVLDIDIIRGNEKTAALIPRGAHQPVNNMQVKNAGDQNFTSFSRLYPLAEEESSITSDQLVRRLAGETVYQGMTRLDRMRLLAFNNHKEHARRFVRLFERLAAQSALTGKMDAILGTGNSELQYDFRRNAENTITVGTPWDNAAATIMSDIDVACDTIRKNGKITPDTIVLGGDAMDSAISNAAFQGKADNRRFELIEVGLGNPVPAKYQRMLDSGFAARGRLRTAQGYELWMFTYVDGYEAANGDFVPYMPKDKALVFSCSARADRYFGPGENMPHSSQRLDLMATTFGFTNPETLSMPEGIKNEGLINPAMFYYDAYAHHNNKGVVCRTQAAPIFATTQTDAFCLLEGLNT